MDPTKSSIGLVPYTTCLLRHVIQLVITNELESIQKNCITGSNSLTACQSNYISSISPNDKQDGLDAVDVLKRIQINEDGPFFSKPNYVAQELQKINQVSACSDKFYLLY